MNRYSKNDEDQFYRDAEKKKVELFQDDDNPWWIWALLVVILLIFAYGGNLILS